ncbi:MAG: nicotinate (nicotinamide) nucleotide adenylyltransferase [Verrucomicrobiales bacterium]|nr:nicotinate (nicotinamide) nucleotide adenylyltransferase [Verrucomicrobiales bacterium]
MKLGIFGGTFDPPHLGHLTVAEEAWQTCGLDRVVFIPCHQSPHKETAPGATDDQRLEMVRLMVAGRPWADVSDWELRRPGRSYSWETAEHFSAQFPDAELHWILGADQWNALPRWARPDVLARMLTFIVFPRKGLPRHPIDGFRAVFLQGRVDVSLVSSTGIRSCIGSGKSASGLALEAVLAFIAAHELYRKK